MTTNTSTSIRPTFVRAVRFWLKIWYTDSKANPMSFDVRYYLVALLAGLAMMWLGINPIIAVLEWVSPFNGALSTPSAYETGVRLFTLMLPVMVVASMHLIGGILCYLYWYDQVDSRVRHRRKTKPLAAFGRALFTLAWWAYPGVYFAVNLVMFLSFISGLLANLLGR